MFNCERCGYSSLYKGNLKNHLNRRIICKPLLKDIDIESLKEKINKNKKLIKNVSIGSPNVSMDVSIGSPNVSIGSPNVSMDVSIGSPNVSIGSPNVSIGNTDVSIGNTDVNMDVSIGNTDVSMDVSIENYKCRFCFKIFKHRQSRHRHELVYCSDTTLIKEPPKTLPPLNIIDDAQSNDIQLSEYIKVIEKEKKDMWKENKLMKREKKDIEKENKLIKREKKAMGKEIEKLLDKVGNVTNNNNMLQQNIIINNYGNENLDYLTEGYLTNLLKIPWGSVLTLLKDIHFNVNHPENHNVKILNRKEKFAIVFMNGEWEIRMKKEVISSMVDMSYNIVECCFEDNKMILSDTKRNNFIEFQTNYDNGNLKKMIEGDLEVELLNN